MKQLIFSLMFLTGCGQGIHSYSPNIITTDPATVAQCPYGGIVYNSTPICNGATGNQGPQGNVGQAGTNAFTSGLTCGVYSVNTSDENGTVNWNTLLTDGNLKFTTVLSQFNVPNESSNDIFASFTAQQQALIGYTNYALDCSGYINIAETGNYTFTLGSDDGSELAIDEASVINMADLQPYASKTATVPLFSGMHRINVLYFQGPATNIGLTLSWKTPTSNAAVVVPNSVLFF